MAALAANCPSSAITYERLDGGANESPPLVNVVRIRENGPLAMRNGAVNVMPQPNGPLKVEGPLEVLTGTGRAVLTLDFHRASRRRRPR